MSSSEQTLSPLNRQLLSHYEMVRGMVSRLAEDFTAEEAVTRAGDLKPLVWYLGHIAQTEAAFLKLFDGTEVALSEEHAKRFGRGSDGSLDHSDASKEELVALLDDLHARMKGLLSSLSEEDLSREAGVEVAIPVFKQKEREDVEAFNGMGKSNPWHAALMTMCMLSLAGIPPMAGFIGKYYIFSEAIRNGYAFVTIIAIITSMVGVYYYFKVILAMYTKPGVEGESIKLPIVYDIVLMICVAASLLFGLWPKLLMTLSVG